MTDASQPLAHTPQAVTMAGSEGLWAWLNQQHISLAFSTYQTNRLFLVGCKADGHLAVNERLFDKPMGLYVRDNSLYMACRYQLWQLENRLAAGESHQGGDRLYVPSRSYTTGDVNVHDLVVTADQQLLFINTDFSCLATLSEGHSFAPLWQPPFISKLVAEDRCHLNGLAMYQGQPTYVTACSTTDTAAGWRKHRTDGGVVMHIPSNEVIATGLSMPHSPRWYRGKLWLLNSGTGELGYLDWQRFCPVSFCPGFVRGLAFWGDYAVVGLSKLRAKTFGGLVLETRLADLQQASQCGLAIIDLNTGALVHRLHIDGVVEELFDVVVLPQVRQPRALGFQNDDIDRLINFPQSGGLVSTKPTVSRPSLSQPVQKPGLPRNDKNAIHYQRVYQLSPENLVPYEAMTNPSLIAHWRTQPLRGELLGISASVAGEMVGFAVAEQWHLPDTAQAQAQLLSLWVLPAYHAIGIEAALRAHLQHWLGVAISQ
ncbi:MAG: TIGR03032 family protein [Methylococcaceae bacterium]|nr:TIGR03032 family protein [Methylococcaceae bacterium]